MNITVCIATHEGRGAADDPSTPLGRAVASVYAQSFLPSGGLAIALDVDGEGAAATRNRALELVETPWVAFLDSDDELYPDHLKLLARCARLTGADVIYPGYDCDDDPVNCFGLPYDGQMLQQTNFIPVTTLCKTEKVVEAGGFQAHPDVNGDPCEDWGLWLAMAEQGCTFMHLPIRTWRWNPGGTRGKSEGMKVS